VVPGAGSVPTGEVPAPVALVASVDDEQAASTANTDVTASVAAARLRLPVPPPRTAAML